MSLNDSGTCSVLARAGRMHAQPRSPDAVTRRSLACLCERKEPNCPWVPGGESRLGTQFEL